MKKQPVKKAKTPVKVAEAKPKKGTKHREQTDRKPAQAGRLS